MLEDMPTCDAGTELADSFNRAHGFMLSKFGDREHEHQNGNGGKLLAKAHSANANVDRWS
jgi:hypothetical protein